MLEHIARTARGTGANLYFRSSISEKEIFSAITESLGVFYQNEFLDELVDEEFHREGLKAYVLNASSRGGRTRVNNADKWTHKVFGRYLTDSPTEHAFLGFIDLFQNGSTSYTLNFSFKHTKRSGKKFHLDEEKSSKHAERYFDFVTYHLNPDRMTPNLYLVGIKTQDSRSLEQGDGYNNRTLLLRKLQRTITSKIDFPFVFLSKYRFIKQDVNSYTQHGLEYSEQADWLHDFVINSEDPMKKLTGQRESRARTIMYPVHINFQQTLLQLKQKLRMEHRFKDILFYMHDTPASP